MSSAQGGSTQELVLGSRGSDLALAQLRMVEAALRSAHPELELDNKIIRTSGDEKSSKQIEVTDPRAGRKGMFTAEIERALARSEIDVAVHSAKDLPSEPADGLEIGAVLPRARFHDVLITREQTYFSSLPPGGTIATGSVRRRRQLLWKRPDLAVVDLRGNVPTRLQKFAASSWSGIVLARAGLERLGIDLTRGHFDFNGAYFCALELPTDVFLPAGGQGVIALQIRSGDARAKELTASINDAATFACVRAEREFLRLLQGDCNSPVGVLAMLDGGVMRIRAQVFDDEQSVPREAELEVRSEESHERIALMLMEELNGQ